MSARRFLWSLAALALAAALATLLLVPTTKKAASTAPSWDSLIAPYALRAEVARGYTLGEPRRGREDDVIFPLQRARPGSASEHFDVHVVPRGKWPGIRETTSFGVAYEIPGSNAAVEDMEAITEALAVALRAHDAGFPSTHAIPLRAEADSTALPRFTDALRGTRGAAVGLCLLLLGALFAAPAPMTSWIALFGAALCAAAGLWAPDSTWVQRGLFGSLSPWLVVIAVLATLVASSESSNDRKATLLLGAVAAALRLALGPYGPFRIHGVAPMWIDGAAGKAQEIAAYGSGFAELFGPLAALAPSAPDRAIFMANAIASASVPVAAFVIGRQIGLDRFASFAAGLLIAIDPVAIRFGATESYFACGSALIAWSTCAGLVAAQNAVHPKPGRTVAYTLAAGVLAIAAVRIHPALWLPAALLPATILAVGAPLRFGHRLLITASLLPLLVGLVIATSAGDVLDVVQRLRTGALLHEGGGSPPFTLGFTPGALIALFVALVVGFFVLPHRHLLIPFLAGLAALLFTARLYDQGWLWQQSFCRLYLTVPVVVLASALPDLRTISRPRLAAAFGLVAAAWLLLGWPFIRARTTEHLEYHFLRGFLARLPVDCRVLYVASVGHDNLFLPLYAASPRPRSAFIALREGDPSPLEQALRDPGCAFYIHTSLCSLEGRTSTCEAIERGLSLTPVERASFPALPSSDRIRYEGETVDIVISRIVGRGSTTPERGAPP